MDKAYLFYMIQGNGIFYAYHLILVFNSYKQSSRMPPVEIQWCDHSSVLLEYLRQLYEEERFVDVGLECEGRQVKAHKAVISACSPYLEVGT